MKNIKLKIEKLDSVSNTSLPICDLKQLIHYAKDSGADALNFNILMLKYC